MNLASRVTGGRPACQRAGDREVRDAAPDEFRWSPAGAKRLKGFRDPVPLYRARRKGR